MSTVAIFNGFGQYEAKPDGEKGITLTHGGVPFWFPFDKVTYVTDFVMREVDHDASTAKDGEEEGVLQYKTFRLSGERIAEELLDTQIPTPNREKGIIVIQNDRSKRLNTYTTVAAGYDDLGRAMTTEIQEIEPTEYEVAEAHTKAREYKQEVINTYFQGKRERMSGGNGRLFPAGLVKTFMTELGVKDIDDVSKQLEAVATSPGITPEMLLSVVRELISGLKGASLPAIPVVVDDKPITVKDTQEKKQAQSLV